MGKLGKITAKATYGILDLAMKPVYDQMRKERKEEVRRWNKSLKQANEDAMIEAMQPRRFEVRQPFDAIIHYHPLW
jgi:chemotaxis regulatin CheY-phosphate phosphatase CheZ